MTKLTDLDATFVCHLMNGAFAEVATIAEANGVKFDCPKCGCHSVLCWDRTIPPPITPGPGRWDMTGTDLTDLTLNPSIDLSRSGVGCLWHGGVMNGDAQ